jgi:hypothetical protein
VWDNRPLFSDASENSQNDKNTCYATESVDFVIDGGLLCIKSIPLDCVVLSLSYGLDQIQGSSGYGFVFLIINHTGE